MSTRRIAIATGTRADWGLLSQLARALTQTGEFQVIVIATNSHLDPARGNTIEEIRRDGFEPLCVPMPLGDESPAAIASAMGIATGGFAEIFAKENPEMVVILGDRFEMLAVASAATVMRIPIVHIAGGEISLGAIDDNIRHAITKLAALHLTATEPYRRRIIRLGEHPSRVITTGAIGVWNLANRTLMSREELRDSLGFDIDRSTLLVTLHPATMGNEAVGTARMTDNLLAALDSFPDCKVLITYPNNDAEGAVIIRKIEDYARRNPEGRVHLIPSLGQVRYFSALQFVGAVVGNSSSGIVEVPSMGVPVVNIRPRQNGRAVSPAVISADPTEESIRDGIMMALSPEARKIARETPNPYFRPDTLRIMVDAIRNADPAELRTKIFYEEAPSLLPPPPPALEGSMKPLFVIPARSGSKGIPGKNIRPLGGRPLIAWSIDVAKSLAADDDHIIFSSDSEDYCKVARSCGLAVNYLRPEHLATDTAGSREVILDAMRHARSKGVDFNVVVLLQPTSPLRTADDVSDAMRIYAGEKGQVDMVVSVTEASANPYYNCFEADPATGFLRVSKGDGLITRRQDAPPAYEFNGAVYVINPASVEAMPLGAFPRRLPSVMPRQRSVDLDSESDWQLAELILSKR